MSISDMFTLGMKKNLEYALSTSCFTLSAQNYDYIRNLLSHNALMFHVLLLRVCFESFVYDHARLLPPMG